MGKNIHVGDNPNRRGKAVYIDNPNIVFKSCLLSKQKQLLKLKLELLIRQKRGVVNVTDTDKIALANAVNLAGCALTCKTPICTSKYHQDKCICRPGDVRLAIHNFSLTPSQIDDLEMEKLRKKEALKLQRIAAEKAAKDFIKLENKKTIIKDKLTLQRIEEADKWLENTNNFFKLSFIHSQKNEDYAEELFCINRIKILSDLRNFNTNECHNRILLINTNTKLFADFYPSCQWSIEFNKSRKIAVTPNLFVQSMHSSTKRLNNKDVIKTGIRKGSRSFKKNQWLKNSDRVSSKLRKLVNLVKEINNTNPIKIYINKNSKPFTELSQVSKQLNRNKLNQVNKDILKHEETLRIAYLERNELMNSFDKNRKVEPNALLFMIGPNPVDHTPMYIGNIDVEATNALIPLYRAYFGVRENAEASQTNTKKATKRHTVRNNNNKNLNNNLNILSALQLTSPIVSTI